MKVAQVQQSESQTQSELSGQPAGESVSETAAREILEQFEEAASEGRSDEAFEDRLSPEDELEMFRRLRSEGDPNLREALAVRHLHLVPPIVRKYRARAEWEDLIQVGYIGLIKAVDNFDCERNARFATYATHCVHGELRHYLRDRVDVVRKPRWLTRLSRQVAAYIERHLHEKHRLPTVSEIAIELNISEEGIVEILRSRAPVSLDAAEEKGTFSVEKIRTRRYETFRLPIEDRIMLLNALDRLMDMERSVIYMFFYRDLTQRQIADEMDLSPKKVSRVMKRGLEKLHEILTREIF